DVEDPAARAAGQPLTPSTEAAPIGQRRERIVEPGNLLDAAHGLSSGGEDDEDARIRVEKVALAHGRELAISEEAGEREPTPVSLCAARRGGGEPRTAPPPARPNRSTPRSRDPGRRARPPPPPA